MSIDDYVSISVSRETQAPTQTGFSTLGILAYHTAWAEYQRQYDANAEGLAQMILDGFTRYDPAYRAASRAIGQDGHPEKLRVLRRATPFSQQVVLTVTTITVGAVVSVVIVAPDGSENTASYTVVALDTLTLVATGLRAAIVALGLDLTLPAMGGAPDPDVEINATNAGELFYFNDLANCTYDDVTVDPGVGTDLDNIVLLGSDDWYGLVIDSESKAEIEAVAAWIEPTMKIFGAAVRDSDTPTSGATDVATALASANYDRTFTVPTKGSLSTYPTAAWFGLRLGETPGDANWAFAHSAAGVVADGWTGDEKTNIKDKKSNYYINTAGFDHYFPGHMASGEFIDIITLIDWSVARIQEEIFGDQIASKKIPFTDKGVSKAKACCFSVLRRQMKDDDSGGFVQGTEFFSAPKVADVAQADKAVRYLPNCVTGAQFTNAINKVGLRLTLTL